MSKRFFDDDGILRVGAEAASTIGAAVVAAGRRECMGLLGRPASSLHSIVAAIVMDAQAGPGTAEAAAPALHAGVAALREIDLVPAGLWHSHGLHPVWESRIDAETFLRLAPALAAHDLVPVTPFERTPHLVAPDTAVLPGDDGHGLRFRLLGRSIAGLGVREAAKWTYVATEFTPVHGPSCATLVAGQLRLVAGGVVVMLGLPPGATIETETVDSAPCRIARTFSLIVNRQGAVAATSHLVVAVEGRWIVGSSESVQVQIDRAGASLPDVVSG